VSGIRVLRVTLVVALAVIALSGCMRPRVAVAPPPPPPVVAGSPDAMMYGAPPPVISAAPRPAIAAAPPRFVPAPPPVVAEAPLPVAHAAYVARAPIVVSAPRHDGAYHLDAGDKLRIVVYGQEGLTNTYTVDASGHIEVPLIGVVSARGSTPAELAQAIADKLRTGFVREPYVAAEVEQYRPFFILGEVTAPGQYPYVPNMTAESAVAIAGGYTPRAKKNEVKLSRRDEKGAVTVMVAPNTPLRPGDTIVVGERWL
jgi:polysaccharide biosynthesis/export protein